IAAQLVGHKRELAALTEQQQNLTALSDQISFIKQTIDGATIREQDIKNSVEAMNSRVLDAQTRADELSPRLLLEEKARKDLGTLISLFVKRLARRALAALWSDNLYRCRSSPRQTPLTLRWRAARDRASRTVA